MEVWSPFAVFLNLKYLSIYTGFILPFIYLFIFSIYLFASTSNSGTKGEDDLNWVDGFELV